MTRYILILFLFFSVPAMAHDFTFSWLEPTERTDGTALDPETEISAYKMRCEGPQTAERIIERSASSSTGDNERRYIWVDAVQTSGVYQCHMTAFDTGDRESPQSNIATAEKFAAPAPPTDFRTVP